MAGFDNDVLYAKGFDTRNVTPIENQMQDGYLLIGRTAADANGSFVTATTLTAGANISIVPGPGTITISASGGGGGGSATNLSVDAFTGPGTDPVVPDGGDVIDITGAQVAAGTTANVIRTNSTAANQLKIEIQRGTAAASGDSSKNGVIHLDSAQFSVAASGFTQLTGNVPLTFTSDAGSAQAAANILSLIGGSNGIDTTASGSTVTFNFDVTEQPAIATSFVTDSGTGTATTNTLNIVGSGGVTVSASGNTVTVNGSSAGGLVQQVRASTAAVQAITNAIPFDDTIPQQTEGDEVLTVSITPTSASSVLVIEAYMTATSDSQRYMTMALFRDSTADAISATLASRAEVASARQGASGFIRHYESSGSTDATTFKLRVGVNTSNDSTVNGDDGDRRYGGVAATNIFVTEYTA